MGCQSGHDLNSNSRQSPFNEGPVIARVDGIPITKSEFDDVHRRYPTLGQHSPTAAEGKRVVLNQIIELKTIERLAQKAGIDQTPEFQLEKRWNDALLLRKAYLDSLLNTLRKTNDPLVKKMYSMNDLTSKSKGTHVLYNDLEKKYLESEIAKSRLSVQIEIDTPTLQALPF
jgi:hypothetical protein